MSSNLRVDRILPSTGTEVGVGTATGSVALYGDVNVAGTLTYEDVTNIDSVGIVTARSDVYLGNDIYLTDGSSGHEQVEVDSNDIRVTGKHIHSQFGVWTGSSSGNDRRNGISGDNNDLRLYSNSTEKVRIKSDGDVYIGNIAHSNEGGVNSSYRTLTLTDTTNGAQLHLRGQSPKLFLDVTSGGNGEVYYDSGDLRILSGEPGTTSSEKLRITSAGRLLVGGSTSARSTFFNSSSWTTQVQIENNTDQKSSLSLICSHATNNQAGLLALGATKSSSLGGNGLTGSSQGLGIITFQGNDGSQMVEAARIACVAAGTPSADNMPGELRFSVNSGSSGASEKVRISSSGVAINKNAAADAELEIVQSADPTIRLHDNRNAAYKADFLGGDITGTRNISLNGSNGSASFTGKVDIGSSYSGGEILVNIGANGASNPFTYLRFGASQYGAADIRPTNEASHKVGLAFYTDGTQDTTINPTERLRITSNGRLLLGHTSLTGDSDSAHSRLVVNGNTQASSKGGIISLEHTQPVTNIYNNHQLGQIFFKAESGEEFGLIKVEAQGNASSTSCAARMMFSTTTANSTTPTERLRISHDGESAFRPDSYGLGVRSIAGSSSVTTCYFGAHSSGSMSTGTITYEVYTNGNVKNTNNSYSQLSDERLKENIIDAPSQWDDIKSLRIRKYNFRDNNGYETHTQIGLVAQETESVCPGLVQETPVREDATPVLDADGNALETTKSVSTSVLYMKSVKALQEAQTRIEALEAAVAALQGS